jgi:hypothetical protein
MKKVLVSILLLFAIGLLAVAGPTYHIKSIVYDNYRLLAPGVGIQYNLAGPFSVGADYSFTYLTFESAASGCLECEVGEWRLMTGGLIDAQLFFDIPVGGCAPGPCDRGVWRLGAGFGIPNYFGISNIEGILFGGPEIGLMLSAARVFDNDFVIRGEVYWAGDKLGYGIGVHVDVFTLGELIRGPSEELIRGSSEE